MPVNQGHTALSAYKLHAKLAGEKILDKYKFFPVFMWPNGVYILQTRNV